jgi:hypothetical protein
VINILRKKYYLRTSHYDTIGRGYNDRSIVECGETPAEAIAAYRKYRKSTFNYGDSGYSVSRPWMVFEYVDDDYEEPEFVRPTTVEGWRSLQRRCYGSYEGLYPDIYGEWSLTRKMIAKLMGVQLIELLDMNIHEILGLLHKEIEKLSK